MGYQPSVSVEETETGNVRIEGKRAVTTRKSIRQSLMGDRGFFGHAHLILFKGGLLSYINIVVFWVISRSM